LAGRSVIVMTLIPMKNSSLMMKPIAVM
jgi:hypothetical protein